MIGRFDYMKRSNMVESFGGMIAATKGGLMVVKEFPQKSAEM
jgi:hypothetical protein